MRSTGPTDGASEATQPVHVSPAPGVGPDDVSTVGGTESHHAEAMTGNQVSPTTALRLDEESRRVAAAAVAAAAIGWWPAFTFGAYGVIFFEQRISLWAISLTAFVVLGLVRGVRAWRRPAVLSLLLPSLWLLFSWLLPAGGTSPASQALFWFGVVVTVIGMPAWLRSWSACSFPRRIACAGPRRCPGSGLSSWSCWRPSVLAPNTRGFLPAATSQLAATTRQRGARREQDLRLRSADIHVGLRRKRRQWLWTRTCHSTNP